MSLHRLLRERIRQRRRGKSADESSASLSAKSPARRDRTLPILVHFFRVACVAALLLLIPAPGDTSIDASGETDPPGLTHIRARLPDAASVDPAVDANGFWTVRDAQGQPIASVARSLPLAADVVGYRGPSESLILLDDSLQVLGVDLLQSADTAEHVETVRNDADFFRQFRNWQWGGPPPGTTIDAVSGATLTSLALAEGVLRRMGGDRPSLVFPKAVTADELQPWFETVAETRRAQDRILAMDERGNLLGRVVRTGPLCDDLAGYQGPTELLIRLDPQTTPSPTSPTEVPGTRPDEAPGSVQADQSGTQSAPPVVGKIVIRSSYDNEPYVRYCRTEYGFWKRFQGKTIGQLAAMDLQSAGVEGVSGATMTSMAIAKTLVRSAAQLQQRDRSRAQSTARSRWDHPWWRSLRPPKIRWSPSDLACVALLLAIPPVRHWGGFRNARFRKLWLMLVIVIVGLWSGNLISLALVAGWSAEGIAWQLAPGLGALAAVALLSPPLGKSNPYCNHLCPHGALQQWARPSRTSRRHVQLSRQTSRWLRRLPGLLLASAYVALLLTPSVDLSGWEPFHAYLFRIAPWTAIAFAIATLVFSAFVPMGFCRMGCPSGRLLDYLRRSATSDRLRSADAVALGLLILAIVFRSAR
ncbi:FMN-binding protein [Roseiconus nitratireducens]|uniref:FMN-binding protein n=1 Tax=Roseiconus nitratireducens TaxID=2605748 RepID=A0A5M6DNA0_9BACT|nr:FMN-binding protein [Roseiconus nitratireducens]KAA5546895.1 FMN-binding protein [Roseiconus nitratireducens]